MEIRALKLVNGEEILTELTRDGDEIRIKNPLLIVMQRTPNGEVGMGFMPYMPYAENREFTLSKSHVIFLKEVDDSLRNQYSAVFGGIVTPVKKIVV